MWKKSKIEFNDNLVMILEYINSQKSNVSYLDIIQFVKDYDLYNEYYLNYHIIKDLIVEKNQLLNKKDNNGFSF